MFEPDEVSSMLFFPLLSFFLMYRWLHSLENVTSEIMSKSTAVARREAGSQFDTQVVNASMKVLPNVLLRCGIHA